MVTISQFGPWSSSIAMASPVRCATGNGWSGPWANLANGWPWALAPDKPWMVFKSWDVDNGSIHVLPGFQDLLTIFIYNINHINISCLFDYTDVIDTVWIYIDVLTFVYMYI